MVQEEKLWQTTGIGLLPYGEEAGRSDSMMELKNSPTISIPALFLQKKDSWLALLGYRLSSFIGGIPARIISPL